MNGHVGSADVVHVEGVESLALEGKTAVEIATALKITAPRVHRIAKALGVLLPPPRKTEIVYGVPAAYQSASARDMLMVGAPRSHILGHLAGSVFGKHRKGG